ncbi:MAG: hypothetical protein VKL59_23025 [Nostocaceae cyanobacterium]|nr:hypothetical protein [Nostocaceae cyanobacterium]
MAAINIYQLNPVGSELFQDTESYLNELQESEVLLAFGGDGYSVNSSVISQASESVSLNTVTVITEVKSPASAVKSIITVFK